MIKIGNSESKAFYIGSTPVKEIWKGGTKVWPYGIVTYIVDNFAFAYNIGQMLYVNQGNYAAITARQRKYIDGELEETTTITMTPSRVSGTNRYTIASDGKIRFDIDTYGTTEFNQSTAVFKGTYSIGGETYETGNYTLTLQGNTRSATSTREVQHERIPGTSYRDYRNWYAYIAASSYSSSSSRCPASGGGSTLTINGSHEECTATPWTQDIDIYTTYTYTSERTKEEYTRTTQVSGTDRTTWESKTDTLTPTMVAPDGGFTRNGTAVTIASEGKTIYTNGRTATFTVTNGTATQSVTIYQQYNILEVDDPETTTAFAINSVSKVTSSGATIQIAGTRTYKTAYKKWTSLAEEGGETKTEQNRNADSIQIVDTTTHTWAHADTGGKLRIDANTTSETDRSVQFWAVCGDYTAKNGSATQWRSDYYTYTYSVDRFGLQSTSLEWDETASTEVLLTVYRTSTLHHDGGSTVIGTTTSPDDLTISLTGNTTHFSLFNNTRGTRGTSIAAKSGESIYVDVVGRNDGQTDLITTINNSISDDKDTLTHKHRVAPADAVTIENKSTYNLMIRWEERSSSEITIPAGETGYLLGRRDERIEFKVTSGSANIVVKSSGETVGSGTVTTDWTNIGVKGGELGNWSMIITNL